MSPSQEDKVSIVVCDDQPAVAQGLARVLEAERDELSVVGIANDARRAEALVKETLPDIAVMDIYMPDVDGIEATRRIRAACPSTQVVILTASEREEDLYRGIKAGALGYVTKDQDPSSIADVIMAVHHKNYALPAHLAGRMLQDVNEKNLPDYLDDDERTILAEIAAGNTDKQIAASLHVGERTVRRRIHNIYEKLHLADRVEAALFAARRGIAPYPGSSKPPSKEEG
ncbi:MAG TPA: response regulator transcription factor [Actinomycetota bacterium]|nr:response regulator transcription factor [Actinomycetota bacterium]